MATFDQMIIDDRELANRYFGENNINDLDNEQYLFTKQTTNDRENFLSQQMTKQNSATGLFGRRVFLESPSLGNKDEEDLYRYVPSRLSDHTGSILGTSAIPPSGEILIDSLDFELDLLGATNTNHKITYQPKPLTQISKTDFQRADPRQDPLLGPLLAELEARTIQPPRLPPTSTVPISNHRRNSVPYEPNLSRTIGSTESNRTITNTRIKNNALLEPELYDSLDTQDQKRPSIPPPITKLNSSAHTNSQLPSPLPPITKLNSSAHTNSQLPPPPPSQQNLLTRPSNMNSTDIFYPSSYNNAPSFLSNFGPEDQLFQQPLFNAAEQNYVPNARVPPPPQQQYEPRDSTFDNSYSRLSPPRRAPNGQSQQVSNTNQYQQQLPSSNRQTTYNNYQDEYSSTQQRQPPSQQFYEGQTPRSNNQEMFFTDQPDDQFTYNDQQQSLPSTSNQHGRNPQEEQDSKRQAVWNELQRTNAKVQEKNAKKRESANRREQLLKGVYVPYNARKSDASQQPSSPSKTGQNSPTQRRPPPIPVSKTNFIDDNIDMIKNKENFYHRYPAKKYENLYTKRKDLGGENPNEKRTEQNQNQDVRTNYDQSNDNVLATYNDSQHRASLPVTINLNPGDRSQTGNLPASVTIPLDSHVTRAGDKISVNIDLRLVDLQNLKKQQQEHPDWSGLDPLDRHIRKLERSIDQSLPQTNSPTQRSPTLTNPTINASMGRYGKLTNAGSQGGYSPPNYSSEKYSYGEKGQEDSYLAKMNHIKNGPNFKPYTGKDYEQFKKNHGVTGGYLGFDFDNPTYKEKSDKLVKTKEYAQQIEQRNKKILAEAPRRTLSDTRIPKDVSTTQRALEYARVSTRHKPPSGTSTRSTPPETNGATQQRRPTEVLHRPPIGQKQPMRSTQNDDNDLVERLAMRHERDKAQVQGILNPSQKRREPIFDEDDRRLSDIERLAQDRANQRRTSPPKQFTPTNTNGRRPLRFDKPLIPDESTYPPPQQYRPVQQQQQQLPLPVHQRTAQQQYSYPQQTTTSEPYQDDSNVDELANRHNDERMLMEAIRQELSERPLADDEELIVVEQ